MRLTPGPAKNGGILPAPPPLSSTLFSRTRRTSCLLALLSLLAASGCFVLYPELAARLRQPAPGQALDPPPPDDIRWLRIVSARIPERTRDGRSWDDGGLPDPYARVLVNGQEILRTGVQSDTLEPTWPGSPSGNFRVVPGDRLRVELWESNPLVDTPIGIRELASPSFAAGELHVELEGGGSLTLAFEPARARIGLGLSVELRPGTAVISRVMAGGSAERAGLAKGDEVLEIDGRPVRRMSAGEIQSALNAAPHGGLTLLVKHPTGKTERVRVLEGPVYPLFDAFGAIE